MQKQPETLGEIIKVAREKSDLTVEELTTRIGISERYLYRIENEGKVPKFEVLKKLVRELAIDANSIFYPEKPSKLSYLIILRIFLLLYTTVPVTPRPEAISRTIQRIMLLLSPV